MTTLRAAISDRRNDFNIHLALADALDRQLFEGDPVSIGETILTARHLLTIKSGLVVHLYNIVEATMTRVIAEIGTAVLSSPPSDWTHNTLREWLRYYAQVGTDGNEDTRLEVVHKAALKLLMKEPISELRLKKPSGTWSDTLILEFSRRLNVSFRLNEEIARKIQRSSRYGDMTPLEFLAERRNAIAHGRRSFEDGAVDLTLQEIRTLSETTLDYLEFAVDAFQAHIDQRQFEVVAGT